MRRGIMTDVPQDATQGGHEYRYVDMSLARLEASRVDAQAQLAVLSQAYGLECS